METRISIKYVSIEGARIAYREAGEGPAILLFHGLGGNSASWAPQMQRFCNRYRAVAWDMPGFGQSELHPATTTAEFSDLSRRFMDAVGIEQAVGIGTSYGSIILADLAREQPARIRSLVLVCPVTGMGRLPVEERARLRAVRRAELAALGQRRFAEQRNSTYLGQGASEALAAQVVALAASARQEGYLAAYAAMTESDIFLLLDSPTMPALVLAGADDPIAPAQACARIAAALRADYHCLEQCGHYVNLEKPDDFNRRLDDFQGRTNEGCFCAFNWPEGSEPSPAHR